jgi:hypothetical protein
MFSERQQLLTSIDTLQVRPLVHSLAQHTKLRLAKSFLELATDHAWKVAISHILLHSLS